MPIRHFFFFLETVHIPCTFNLQNLKNTIDLNHLIIPSSMNYEVLPSLSTNERVLMYIHFHKAMLFSRTSTAAIY